LPAGVLSQVSRLLRLLSALGTRGLSAHRAPAPLKPIGIVSALAAEARTLGPAARHGAELRRLADGALLAVSGIGEGAAAAAARRLVLAGAGGLVSFGMAGGLDPTLICGAVLLPEEIATIGGVGASAGAATAATSAEWRRRLRGALPASCIV